MENNIPVVATSSTCTFTIRDEYEHILDIDTSKVRENIELATRYIYRLLEEGRELPLKHTPLKVVYHTPLPYGKMGWAAYPLILIKTYSWGRSDCIRFTMLWYCRVLMVLNRKTTMLRKALGRIIPSN